LANPTAGCGVQQTREPSKDGSSDPSSAEETVEAGRNGKNGTSTGRGSPAPKSGRRPRREWTQATVVSAKGRIDEPHERSPTTGLGLRAEPSALDRANRDVSQEESCPSLDPTRSTHGEVEKAKRSTSHGVSATTRHGFGHGFEVALELWHCNLWRSRVSVRRIRTGFVARNSVGESH
jgi:hypothetical protein